MKTLKNTTIENVDHSYLRYSNCWEDAEVLRRGLQVQSGDRVLSIGSAGDNSFSLLVDDPESVLAVDINPVQLHLIELKKAAYTALTYEEFLALLGVIESEERLVCLRKLEAILPDDTRQYWQAHQELISNGLLSQGKFERYFARFRSQVLPLIHPRSRVDQYYQPKTQQEHEDFFDHTWNTWRWRGLFRLFFSKRVMGVLGRDPAFLREVDVSVSSHILQRANSHLRSVESVDNPFLHFIFTGQFDIDQLPHALRRDNFEIIKSRIDRLTTQLALVHEVDKSERFDKFNLSNIFEYLDLKTTSQVVDHLIQLSNKNARYAYWNLLVPRNLADREPRLVLDPQSQTYATGDTGFFYSRFITHTLQ